MYIETTSDTFRAIFPDGGVAEGWWGINPLTNAMEIGGQFVKGGKRYAISKCRRRQIVEAIKQ